VADSRHVKACIGGHGPKFTKTESEIGVFLSSGLLAADLHSAAEPQPKETSTTEARRKLKKQLPTVKVKTSTQRETSEGAGKLKKTEIQD
jgi:hypothetical protein